MKKVYKVMFFLFLVFIVFPVYAKNKVDYTLNITDDYKFIEVINYEISDYEQPNNGYNSIEEIINKSIPVDRYSNKFYNKTKRFENNKYYITLTNTYNEYSFSYSNTINNCFYEKSFDYDINKYSFSGSEDFMCLKGNDLTISIITNFPVTSTNAIKDGNKYVWIPKNNNFEMNIEIEKQYRQQDTSDLPTDYTEEEKNSNRSGYNTNIPNNNKTNNNQKRSINFKYLLYSFSVLLILFIIVFIILKNKKDQIDKI